MAVVRARSAPPYPLISFVILWVISTALAVYFYMGQSKSDAALADMQKQASDISRPADQKDITQVLTERSGSDSVVATLIKQNKLLKDAIGAEGQSTREITDPNGTARSAAASAGYAGKPLLETINGLKADLDAKNKSIADLTTSIKTLQAQAAQAKADYDTASAQAQQTIADLTAKNTELNKAASALRDTNSQQVTQNEAAITEARATLENEERQQLLEKEQLNTEIAKRDQRIALLQAKVEFLSPHETTNVGREADGTIVRTAATPGECYISLGKKDRIVPGQTFAVYDPRLGVRFSTDEEAAGKGGIEVLEVSATESLCRITHTTPGQAILAGDLIANPVYHQDRSRTFRFVVIGDFDLDGDGVATAQERDRLISMIKSWGGMVEDSVSTQTDFLVVGTKPQSAAAGASDTSQPGSVADARGKVQQSYDDTIVAAKQSSVPILNQNRFLAMIGYYNTTIVR